MRRVAAGASRLAMAVAAAVLAASCALVPPAKPTLLIFGDSVTVISESQAQLLLGDRYTLVFRAAGGAALCDWVAESAWDRAYYRPAKVVIAFTGNNLSSCAARAYASGGQAGLVANYRTSLQRMHSVFDGVPMTVLGAPASRPATPGHPAPPNGNPRLNEMYRSLCQQLGMHYSSRADDTLTPGHRFVWKRPAFPGSGPVVTVRRSDGVHVTPAGALYYAAAFAT